VTTQMTMEIETSTGVWTDISAYVLQRDTLTITHGRGDEQGQAAPSRMSFTLDNRDGRFSPRNPLSPLYGMIGRNTPIRCKIDDEAFTRFYGEVASWPPRWDPSHSDNHVPIDAYGLLRRLSQGQPAVSNALRDYVLSQSTLAAYYPLSGGEGATYSQNIAPGMVGSFRGTTGATFTYGRDMGAAWLGSGMELNAAAAPAYMEGGGGTGKSNAAFDFVFQSPAMGVLDIQLFPTYDSYWKLRLNTSADACTLQVSYYDDDNGLITMTASGVVEALRDTELHTCRFELNSVAGPDVDYLVYIDGVLVDSGTNSLGQTLTGVPLFRFNYSRFVNQTVMNMAHLTLWTDNTAANMPLPEDFTAAAFAYAGETAIDRVFRVCVDGGIPVGTVGTASESTAMGPQFTESRLEQIRDCETTDMGILVEHRSASALLYRSRASMYNQTPVFTLDYAAGHVSPPLEPVDDDQVTRNDVTATRRDGGSARYTVDTGPLSTQDPPDGVGRYDTEVTVNVETDGQLQGAAAWVANVGTLDKARWPAVTVNLSSPNIPTALKDSIKSINVGERFVITNMDDAFVYDDISLIVVGYSETIDPFVHTITFNCMPADPYETVEWATSSTVGDFHWDTDGSELNSSATSTATSLSVKRTTGATSLWTTDSDAFPFDILVGGERMTVTAISSSTSPQTFTVTRSVNGVVKAHAAGTDVRLFNSPTWAL
jgi:hypothetical protein